MDLSALDTLDHAKHERGKTQAYNQGQALFLVKHVSQFRQAKGIPRSPRKFLHERCVTLPSRKVNQARSHLYSHLTATTCPLQRPRSLANKATPPMGFVVDQGAEYEKRLAAVAKGPQLGSDPPRMALPHKTPPLVLVPRQQQGRRISMFRDQKV